MLLTGGEPLLRKDFDEIYLACKKMGFLVSINTNGSLLENYTELFDKLCAKAQTLGIKKVATGVFQADMKVALVNDGPVTLLLDSEKLF